MAATSALMNIMIKAAEKAGRSLTRDFGEVENLQVSRKGPADFVTAADKRAEEIIYEELKKARPSYSFLMEESGSVKGEDTDNLWIVDPLDGTHNFMHGIPHWCVSIALESKGRVEAGIVYDPIKEEIFRAERSGGAFMSGKRLRVSGRTTMESATIGFGSASLNPVLQKQYITELNAVSSVAPMVRRSGSAALDLCYVAAGRFDAYWERGIKAWDVAAGVLIVKESGGFVTSIDNEDNPVHSHNLVAGNQEIYTQTRKILKSVSS
ncbi:MAG TPA: inositol monophosphatase family protein [Alphaproteobacteria bacterium]|nr:inositol monophosphatase family protein [Alphaproteobacteria bacterium]